jgi:sn-glycerol 3-phosphate transport system substrate-binding protein
VIVEKEVEKVVTQVVKETVKETVIVEGTPKVVEKEVTKVVQQEVVVTATPLPPEPVELRVHTRAGVDLDEYFLTVLDDFYARVPDVTVKLEVIPGGALEYASKMLVLAAGGQVGDTVWSASRAGFNRRFMGIGLLKPLDEFVNAEGFDVGQYYDYCIDEATYDGQLMALPHISEPGNVGLSMNLDLFEQAGVDPIAFDSSMDDLIVAAQAIKETTGKFGFERDSNYFNWVTHVRSFGGDFMSADGTKCVLMDDDKALAAVQHLYDIAYTWEVGPKPGQIEANLTGMFRGGTLGMVTAWPIHATAWPSQVEFNMGSTMLPEGPGGRGSMLNQHMMSVAMASEHPAPAWEWVKWTCSAEFSKTRALAQGGGPVGIPEVWHDEELLAKYPAWREWAAVMDEVGPNYNAANLRGKEVEDAFNQGASAIMTEEMGVEEGLVNITTEVQKILDKSIAI